MFSDYKYSSFIHRMIYVTAPISSYVLGYVWEWCCRTLKYWALVKWMIVNTSEILFISLCRLTDVKTLTWMMNLLTMMPGYGHWHFAELLVTSWDSSGCLNPLHCRPNRFQCHTAIISEEIVFYKIHES